MISRSVFSRLVVASLVVLTAIAGPMVGSAAAQTSDTGCTAYDRAADSVLGYVTSEASAAAIIGSQCGDAQPADAVQNLTQEDANQVRSDVHSAATQQAANNRIHFNNYDNDLNSTGPMVWMGVETEVAQAYANGSTQTQTRQRARDVVLNGVSSRAVQLIEHWNASVTAVERAENITDSEANVSDSFVYLPQEDEDSEVDNTVSTTIEGFTTTTVTLPNGTAYTARAINIRHEHDESGDYLIHTVGPTGPVNDVYYETNNFVEYRDTDIRRVRVQAPTSSYEPLDIIDFREYGDRWSRTLSLSQELTSESDVFVNNTWTAFESGTIDPQDVISRNTAMFELAADQVNGNATMYRSTAALGMMGLDVPQLNNTGTMSVYYRGTEYNGMLLAETAPSGSWTAGHTYDTAQMPGPVYLVTTSGEMMTLNGTFQLSNITSADGRHIDTLNHTQTTYQTSNTTELLQRISDQLEYRQEAENREQAWIAANVNNNTTTQQSGGLSDELMMIFAGIGVILLGAIYAVARFSPQGQVARKVME